MTISKIIHQTAPENINKWHPIWKYCQKSWKDCFPETEYQYFFWNDDDLLKLIKNDFPEFLQLYNDFDKHVILKVDFARYAILYKYGGIYSDMDYMCKKNFYNQLSNNICIVESPASNEIIQNSLMASPPNDKRWLDVLQNCKDYYYNFIKTYSINQIASNRGKHIIDISGPRLLSRALDVNSIHILPKNLFNPYASAFNSDKIFTKHYGTGKWGPQAGINQFRDLRNSDKDLYDIYNGINKNKNYDLQNIPEGYLVLECGKHNTNQKTLNLSIPLNTTSKVFVMDHQYSDKMIPVLKNNQLILKRVDEWGWGHNHHVYFTGNQLSNIPGMSFIKNNYIKIKIEKSNSRKKKVKLSVPLHENTSFETIDNLNYKFNFIMDKNDILIVERIDKKEGWNNEFWIHIYSNT